MSSDNRGSTAREYAEEAADIIGDTISDIYDSVEGSVYGARELYRTVGSGANTILDEGLFSVASQLIRESRSRSLDGSKRYKDEKREDESDEEEGNDQHDSNDGESRYHASRYDETWDERDQRFVDGRSQGYLGGDGRYGQYPESPSRNHQRRASVSPGYDECRQSFYEGQRHPTSFSQGNFSEGGSRPATGKCTQCSKTDAPWQEAVEAKFFDDDNGRRRITRHATGAGYRCHDC